MPTIAVKNHDSRHIRLNIDMNKEERDNNMLHIVMTQYVLKTGLNNFNKIGETAVTKELTQMHILETFASVDATKPTKKQRAEAWHH